MFNCFFKTEALVYIENNNINICIKGKQDSIGQYLALIRSNLSILLRESNFRYNEEIGIYRKKKWFYCNFDRTLMMLSKQCLSDFVSELNESVALLEILHYIMPESAINHLNSELNEAKSNLEKVKGEEELLNSIYKIVNENQILTETINRQINRYFNQQVIDSQKIIDDIKKIQDNIELSDYSIHDKLNEAIVEINSGNRRTALQYVNEAIGGIGSVIGMAAIPDFIQMMLNIFKIG